MFERFRNLILFIIVLGLALIIVVGFLYFRESPTVGDDAGGTNFFSQFNPFGSNTTTPPGTTPPVNVSGDTGEEETPVEKL